MRRSFIVCVIVAGLLTVILPMTSHAQETAVSPASAAKPAASANMSNRAEAILLELKIDSPELLEKLTANLAEQKAAIAAWQATTKEAYNKALADRNSEDAATKQQGQAAVAAFTKERIAIQDIYGDKAIAMLTPELLLSWEAAKIARTEQNSLARKQVRITQEQLDAVKKLAADLLKGVDLTKAADIRKVAAEVREQTAKTILTAEQTAARDTPAAPKEAPAPKPDPVKPIIEEQPTPIPAEPAEPVESAMEM